MFFFFNFNYPTRVDRFEMHEPLEATIPQTKEIGEQTKDKPEPLQKRGISMLCQWKNPNFFTPFRMMVCW